VLPSPLVDSLALVASVCVMVALVLLWPPDLALPQVIHRRLQAASCWFDSHRPRSKMRRAAEREWVEALIAELLAGRDPVSGLVAVSASSRATVSQAAIVAARTGGDIGSALRGERSELIRGVGACWEVASGSGAGLVASLSALANSARESERIRREIGISLAEPRATALVLAALPAIGLALGAMLGVEPGRWLLATPAGRVALGLALVLELLGILWAWRIAASVESDL